MSLFRVTIGGIEHDPIDGPVTLPKVLTELRGVGEVRLYRADGTLVARNVGSDVAFIHEPTGRRIWRRKRRTAEIRPALTPVEVSA